MTEAEWLSCTEPQEMLEFLRGKASERKLRLFAVACCSEIANFLRDKRSIRSLRAIELLVDGLVTEKRMAYVREAARQAVAKWVPAAAASVGLRRSEEVAYAVVQAAVETADLAAMVSEAEAREIGHAARKHSQCRLLRDIFANPFRPVPAIDPAWLTWKNGAVITLARDIYDQKDFERMPELGRALRAAGCDDDEVLKHCEQERHHCRGCWVVDLLLGKE